MEIVENVKINDFCSISHKQSRKLIENSSVISGYVTVIKNKGRTDEQIIQIDKLNLLTLGGRDFFHAQVYTNIGAGTRGGNAIAVSDDATDPVDTDTTLVGEITTDGLTRVEASIISHIVGTNLTTLEEVFTATAIFTNLHKSGLFNQVTIGGQMTHAREFDADVDLQIGDTLTITWLATLG